MERIYFAIDQFTDWEGHFDLVGVYFSEEDLLKDIRMIRANNYSIYSATESTLDCKSSNLKKHTTIEFMEKLKEKELKEKEEQEYKEYLRLKEKFELKLKSRENKL